MVNQLSEIYYKKKCVESMSEKKKKSKIREEKLKIKERNYVAVKKKQDAG